MRDLEKYLRNCKENQKFKFNGGDPEIGDWCVLIMNHRYILAKRESQNFYKSYNTTIPVDTQGLYVITRLLPVEDEDIEGLTADWRRK